MIEKALAYLKNKIKSRRTGLKITMFNVFGNGLTVVLNFWLPFRLNIENYSEFVITFSFFLVFSTFFTFGLNSLALKYSCVSYTNFRPVLLLSWIIYLIPSIIVCCILYRLGFNELFFNYDLLGLIKLLAGAILTSFQRISLSLFIGKGKLRSYGVSVMISKGIQSVLILSAVYISSASLVENLPNIFLIQGVCNLIFLLTSGFYLKFNKRTILKSLSLSIENRFLFLNTAFQSLFSGYGLSFFLSPIMLAKDIGLLNIFNQLNNLSVFVSNGLNEGYLKRFMSSKQLTLTNTKHFFQYIMVNNIFILIPLMILSIIYFVFSSNYSFGIYILPFYFMIMAISPFKTIYFNVLIFFKQTKVIFVCSSVYYVLNIVSAYLSYKFLGVYGMIFSLSLALLVYVSILKVFSTRIIFKNAK